MLPIPIADCIKKGSTSFIPTKVFLIIGRRPYIQRAIRAVLFPIPVTATKNPNRAIEGIVYIIFTIPIKKLATNLFLVIYIPRAIPTKVIMDIAKKVR